ncbi:MAG: DUF485 domain-containing protein [Spirochaetales bacterium]|nr:DUF485 domain-containing protein [Spirochaetales bacterium]
MGHGPATDWGEDKAIAYKTRIGLILVSIYGLVYLGFIIINTVFPRLMGLRILFGVNLAVVYGFSLIILAIVMGIIYNGLCTKKEDLLNKRGGKK